MMGTLFDGHEIEKLQPTHIRSIKSAIDEFRC